MVSVAHVPAEKARCRARPPTARVACRSERAVTQRRRCRNGPPLRCRRSATGQFEGSTLGRSRAVGAFDDPAMTALAIRGAGEQVGDDRSEGKSSARQTGGAPDGDKPVEHLTERCGLVEGATIVGRNGQGSRASGIERDRRGERPESPVARLVRPVLLCSRGSGGPLSVPCSAISPLRNKRMLFAAAASMSRLWTGDACVATGAGEGAPPTVPTHAGPVRRPCCFT